jgi:putative mRNA 3-end processing factor
VPGHPETWIHPTPAGLYVEPGGFYVDPARVVDRAVITHGHSDHARPGHRAVLATVETLAIMRARLGTRAGTALQPLRYGEHLRIGEVDVRLVPAGHILGSAQIVLEWRGRRVVVSGDYKRQPDPTCAPFEPVRCDLFITEATFGLPIFRHPPDTDEIDKLLHSLTLFPDRVHQVGVYSLGKCQRVLALLRRRGYAEPIYLHGAQLAMTELYRGFGIEFGEIRPVSGVSSAMLAGRIVLGPVSALGGVPDPLIVQASGWMRVKRRARQSGADLPLVISDHADWDELCRTMLEIEASEIWVTHGDEAALIHQARLHGLAARALSLVGREGDES